jgi:hypothetical protein
VPELPEPELAELDDLLDELPEADPLAIPAELPRVDVACADPGRLKATPAAASTPARPAAAVIVRTLARLRSLAAICCVRPPARGGAESGVIGCLPLEADASSLASVLLNRLCARWQSAQKIVRLPVVPKTCGQAVDGAVERSRAQGINGRCPVDGQRILNFSAERPCALRPIGSRNLSPLKTGSAPRETLGTMEGPGDRRGRRESDTGGATSRTASEQSAC